MSKLLNEIIERTRNISSESTSNESDSQTSRTIEHHEKYNNADSLHVKETTPTATNT